VSARYSILRQSIEDFVEIALVCDIDMMTELQPGRLIDAAGHDRNRSAAISLPEQGRSAFGAESPSGFRGRTVPFQGAACVRQLEIADTRFSCSVKQARLAATLTAMAAYHFPKRPCDPERHRPAQASTAVNVTHPVQLQ